MGMQKIIKKLGHFFAQNKTMLSSKRARLFEAYNNTWSFSCRLSPFVKNPSFGLFFPPCWCLLFTLEHCCAIPRLSPFASSVTRSGEISPLWQKFTSLWQSFDSSFIIWQNTELTLANLWHYWANFHCCKWLNIEK